MKLGNDTIVLRKRVPTGEVDDLGNDVLEDADTEVRWCSVTPLSSSETDDRSVPRVTGARLLAPPGTDVESADAIVWRGRTWEVVGDVGEWPDAVDVTLRRVN